MGDRVLQLEVRWYWLNAKVVRQGTGSASLTSRASLLLMSLLEGAELRVTGLICWPIGWALEMQFRSKMTRPHTTIHMDQRAGVLVRHIYGLPHLSSWVALGTYSG